MGNGLTARPFRRRPPSYDAPFVLVLVVNKRPTARIVRVDHHVDGLDARHSCAGSCGRWRCDVEHEPVLVFDEEFKDLLRELVFLRGHFVIGVVDQARTEYYSKV